MFGQTHPAVAPAPPDPALQALGRALPSNVRLGTSSWSFPGWAGIVWDRPAQSTVLANQGLASYAAHPLFRTVGVDRTFWAPMSTDELREFADAVPNGFRFLVKAHEDLTWHRFPNQRRYGERAGTPNPRFLDASYALDHVVGPICDGLGDTAGPIVFQVPPQGGVPGFPDQLHRFLDALPRGPLYAVEIRDAALLTDAYAAVLHDVEAVHCLTVHPGLPDLRAQWALAQVGRGRALVARWNLAPELSYEPAKQQFSPFDRIQRPDVPRREQLAKALRWAADNDKPAWLIANNKAEGSAPLTLHHLAQRLVDLGS